MAIFKRRKAKNLGTVSIGSAEVPSVAVDDAEVEQLSKQRAEAEKKTREIVEKYRQENPDKPKSDPNTLYSPLKIKREINSLDSEYVEIAKRYLGLPSEYEPTVVDFAKKIIKLFEDNLKLYKEVEKLKKLSNSKVNTATMRSYEHNASWN